MIMAKLKQAKIADLVPDDLNMNKGCEFGQRLVENSIRQFGAGRSILIDKNNRIIAGNKFTENAADVGLDNVVIVETTGNEIVAVKRTDVDLDTAFGREMAAADNATAKADIVWDVDAIQEVESKWDIDVEKWGIDIEFPETEENTDGIEDSEFEPDETKESRIKKGDVWRLGDHRLMCGDSTNLCDIQKIIGKERINLYLSDPPYGVDVVRSAKIGGDKPFGKSDGIVIKTNKYMPIKGDNSTDTAKTNYQFVKDLTENQIIFGGNYFTDFLTPSPCWIVWDKENSWNFADVEMAWTSFDKGAKLYKWLWNGLCRKGERDVELKSRVHPTQKPVGLLVDILNDFSNEGDSILDCFGGSGSTLIACEQAKRRCFMIEFEQHYCEIIIQRWETFTGKKAIKIS